MKFSMGLIAGNRRRSGGPVGVGPHRYWRVAIDNSIGGSPIGIMEIEMRAVSGGPDLCSGGTATASSQGSGSWSAPNAFANDGTASFWRAASASNEWIQYDFGAGNEVEVNYLAMLGYNIKAFTPGASRLQYSDDGVNFTTAFEMGRAYPIAGEFTEYPQAAGVSNLWRLVFADSQQGTSLRAGNIQFRDGPGGTDLFAGAVATTSTYTGTAGHVDTSGNTSSSGAEAFTASNTDYWTKGGGFEAWISVACGAAVAVEEVAFSTPDIDVNFIYPPKNMRLEYYDQAAAEWVTKFRFEEENGWARNETRVLVPAVYAGATLIPSSHVTGYLQHGSSGTNNIIAGYAVPSGNDKILLVKIAGMRANNQNPYPITAVTFGGNPMTEITGARSGDRGGNGAHCVQWFMAYLGDTTPTGDIAVTQSMYYHFEADAITVRGAAQSAQPAAADSTGTYPSAVDGSSSDLTGLSGDHFIVDGVIATEAADNLTATETVISERSRASGGGSYPAFYTGMQYALVNGDKTMSWTYAGAADHLHGALALASA